MKKLFALSLTLLFTATTVATSVMAQNMSFSSIRGVSPKTGVGVPIITDYIQYDGFTPYNTEDYGWSTHDYCAAPINTVVAIPYEPQTRQRLKKIFVVITNAANSTDFNAGVEWQYDLWTDEQALTAGQPMGASPSSPGAPIESTMIQGNLFSAILPAPNYGSLTQVIGVNNSSDENHIIGFDIPSVPSTILDAGNKYYMSIRARFNSSNQQYGGGVGVAFAPRNGGPADGIYAFDWTSFSFPSGWIYTPFYQGGSSSYPAQTPAYMIEAVSCGIRGNC